MTRAFMAVTLVGLLCGVPNATAQEARTYIGGGFMVLPWGGARSVNAETPLYAYTNTGPEAVNVGLLAEVAWFLNPTFAVAVEAALPFQRNPVMQEYGNYSPYRLVGGYREQTFSFLLRAQTPQASRVRAAALGGLSIIHGSLRSRYSSGGHVAGEFRPFGEETTQSRSGFGATFGAELAAAITTRVHIVPQFRFVVIDRGSPPRSRVFGSFGFDKVVYRAAVTMRATF